MSFSTPFRANSPRLALPQASFLKGIIYRCNGSGGRTLGQYRKPGGNRALGSTLHHGWCESPQFDMLG